MQLLQCAYAVKIAALQLQIENQTRAENQEKLYSSNE